MKCDICSKKIDETFLNKIVGTTLYDEKHKKKTVCSACQKQYGEKKEILAQLK